MFATKKTLELRSMPSLVERRNFLLDKMDAIISKAKLEERSISDQENTDFQDAKKEIERIDNTLAAEETMETRGDWKPVKKDTEKQVSVEERAFIRFVQSGETRDLGVAGSGVIVPKTIADAVISKVKELSPLYARMTHYNVTGNLSLPTYDFESHTTGFLTEFQEIQNSQGSFLTIDLKSYPIGTLAKIGRSLLARTDIDVLRIIIEQISMSIANFLNRELITNANATFSGTLQSVNQTVSGGAAISADTLIQLQMTVPSVFQQNSAFLMHPTTFSGIRQLKDTTSNYLMISDNEGFAGDIGYKLLGKPVMLDENMPVFGAASRAVYYGDFASLVANTNRQLETQILLEKFSSEYATGIISTLEMDTNLAQTRGLAVLVGA